MYPKTPGPKTKPSAASSTRRPTRRQLEAPIENGDVSGEESINESINSSDEELDVCGVSMDSDDECQLKGTDYFQEVALKPRKSDNTLKNLDLSVLQDASKCPEKEKATREAVIRHYERSLYPNVYSLLIENFNVVLYGVGSKRFLLDRFKESWLADQWCLKICGYFLELNLKITLIKLSALFDIETTSNESDFLERIANLDDDLPDRFLVIHSMDALFQTDPKIKRFLIKLYTACNGKLHIVATVDNINSGLMFDQKEAQRLNLVYLEATTYESYRLEFGYVQSATSRRNKKGMLGLNEQTQTSAGILNVYKSLPRNSQEVLLIIFHEWIEYNELNRKLTTKKSSGKQDEESGKGLEFKMVCQKAREHFLVTSGMCFSFGCLTARSLAWLAYLALLST